MAASSARAQCVEGCDTIFDLIGEFAGSQFGWVSENLGDLTGDGINEFVLTAPTTPFASGRIYVYDGATGAERFRVSGAAGSWFGFDAVPGGDITGDGVSEVLVGAPELGGVIRGRATAYSGTATGTDPAPVWTGTGEADGDHYGYVVAGEGDFNGDGVSDFAVGAIGHDTAGANAGRVYVYSGADHALITTLDGLGAGHQFGSGLCFVEDLNGDGRDELVVGAQNAGVGGGGLAYVFIWDGAAASIRNTLTPQAGAIDFGLWFMNSAGDVDGDGSADIYVNDFNANRAYVYSGATGGVVRVYGVGFTGGFGIGRMIEDANGDGRADMLLAAWINSSGASQAGRAWVMDGPTGAILQSFTHNVANANFGFDANGMGDVDGDGRQDYLITAASDSSGRGRAYLIAGEVGAPCPADLNGNNTVDGADLGVLLSLWATNGEPSGADLNGDGVVNGGDLGLLLGGWGLCS